jgi:hypothetical protein
VPNTQLNLFQKFGRFLLTGALVFALAFWGTSLIFVSATDGHRDLSLLRLILKSSVHQPFDTWLQSLETEYIPFLLQQRSLMSCYLIASSLAWLVSFFYDGRILRKENAL